MELCFYLTCLSFASNTLLLAVYLRRIFSNDAVVAAPVATERTAEHYHERDELMKNFVERVEENSKQLKRSSELLEDMVREVKELNDILEDLLEAVEDRNSQPGDRELEDTISALSKALGERRSRIIRYT